MSESAEGSQRPGAQQSGPEWLDRLEKVDRHVASTAKKMVRDLHDLAAAAEDEAVGQLLAATARVDQETTQSGILNALLEEGQRFASRTAFFLTRPGEVRGWAGHGFSNVERANLDYGDDSVWAKIASQAGVMSLNSDETSAICRSLGAPVAASGILVPFTLRGQLGGVLYADRLENEVPLGVASLQLLTHSAAQAVETAAVRPTGGSPALTLRSDTETAKGTVSLWQPQEESKPSDAGEQAAEVSASEKDGESTEEEPVGEDTVRESKSSATAVAATLAAAGAAAVGAASVLDREDPEPVADEEEAQAAEEEDEVEELSPSEVSQDSGVAEVELDSEEASADEEAKPETDSGEDDAANEAVDFEMVTEAEEDLQAVDDIEAELEPEPELEDTSDLWAVEEEEDEAEEATFVGTAPVVEPPASEPTPVSEPPPVALPPQVGQETVRLDIAALQGQMPASAPAETTDEETAKLPQWEIEAKPDPVSGDFELEPEEEPAAPEASYGTEPELSEPITASLSTPDFSEDATIISAPRDEKSPMSGGYIPPAPQTFADADPPAEVAPATAPSTEVTPPSTEVQPPADLTPPAPTEPPSSSGFAAPPAASSKSDSTGSSTGTSQVVPPTDIQGPGSAFGEPSAGGGEAIPEGEQALHEEARRLARLLVSEIKLYNEEIIEEGRRSGNIYDRLKDDIDRSRQMYEERIDPRLLKNELDYFRQELVQRLAGGDERLLGY